MDLNQVIQKIPKPILVIGIMVISIIFFVYNDPLRDECEVQSSLFEKKTKGLISAVKINKKIQYPMLNFWRDRCKEGNSIGSCNDYFEGLRTLTKELRLMNENCQVKYISQNDSLTSQLTQAIQIMALVAWGEKPPIGIAERVGWFNETHIRTFCYLKKTFILTAGEENFLTLRTKVYREFPGDWPDKFDINRLVESNSDKSKPGTPVDVAKLMAENRPRAFKSAANPTGTLKSEEIFELSIFSVRCDLYM